MREFLRVPPLPKPFWSAHQLAMFSLLEDVYAIKIFNAKRIIENEAIHNPIFVQQQKQFLDKAGFLPEGMGGKFPPLATIYERKPKR